MENLKNIILTTISIIISFTVFMVFDLISETINNDLPVRIATVLIPTILLIIYFINNLNIRDFSKKMIYKLVWFIETTIISAFVLYLISEKDLIHQSRVNGNILNGVEYVAFAILMVVGLTIVTSLIDIIKDIFFTKKEKTIKINQG